MQETVRRQQSRETAVKGSREEREREKGGIAGRELMSGGEKEEGD